MAAIIDTTCEDVVSYLLSMIWSHNAVNAMKKLRINE